MSLADELLADLDEMEMTEQSQTLDVNVSVLNKNNDSRKRKLSVDDSSIHELKRLKPIDELAKLLGSDRLRSFLSSIAEKSTGEELTSTHDAASSSNTDGKLGIVYGMIENDPTYELVVEASNLTSEISGEIDSIHKYVCDIYKKRFPELETLVADPMDYVMTVKALGNKIERAKHSEELLKFLSPATIMIVSVSASASLGTELNSEEEVMRKNACDMACNLAARKQEIFSFVESKMAYIAPNLSALIGASPAARMMGAAGGLTNLSQMPACNMLVLGAKQRRSQSLGMSSSATKLSYQLVSSSSFASSAMKMTATGTPAGVSLEASKGSQAGFIGQSDIVQSCTKELRDKIARLVACKCALAARVDSCHSHADGECGRKFRSQILLRLEKLEEPCPVKQVKPLPPPIDPIGQRRGGRRARKMKERLGITEMRRQANRMTFGEIEEDAYQDDLGLSLGHLGKSGSGKIRNAQIDAKTKARISQKLHKTIQKDRQIYGGQSTVKKHVCGTASTVAFTPLQGLEIVSAGAVKTAEKQESDSSLKYFSSQSGFSKVFSEIPKSS